ncbi:VanW family protein [Xanthomonas sp. SI]|uniref:VanW family protein n=1 Tax=Xanthomonas sp. SI TaxID=2724123 RepID=UPI001639A77B|nr:VanW family protein [Xanthomonas sp. SI]QNH11148.1 VanW like protein [Xanthomonas sp. SI]
MRATTTDRPLVSPAAATPSRLGGLLFALKTRVLQLRRALRDLRGGPRRHRRDAGLPIAAAAVSESVTALWPESEETSPLLVAGKIHNLRVAARALHGIEVPAGAVFSFWRQLGRATRRRGFAAGRELREGCLVPSIGGGLCQLSNAIYDAALRQGLQIVERHRHTQVIAGSLAERDRDAVVFWNYVDLRLRADSAWRLEVWLDGDDLHVRILGGAPVVAALPLLPLRRTPAATAANDCTRCGREECHRHVPASAQGIRRTWLVDEDWPEFADDRRRRMQPGDRLLALRRSSVAAVRAALLQRWWLRCGLPLPQVRQRAQRIRLRALQRRLGAQDVELVVPQSLLPGLWLSGELQGRRWDVCMTALPMQVLQARLDVAAQRHPDSATLRDFRADPLLVEAERAALAQARHWITPHRELLALAGSRGITLQWQRPLLPDAAQPSSNGAAAQVLLAASALARKGAFELREALRGLPVQLLLPPGAQETPQFWSGFDVRRVASMADGVQAAAVVVLPAWIEQQPRGVLLALALGRPVIATAACGLGADDGAWRCVEAGDSAALRAQLVDALGLPG